jgi:hypothetical protein
VDGSPELTVNRGVSGAEGANMCSVEQVCLFILCNFFWDWEQSIIQLLKLQKIVWFLLIIVRYLTLIEHNSIPEAQNWIRLKKRRKRNSRSLKKINVSIIK